MKDIYRLDNYERTEFLEELEKIFGSICGSMICVDIELRDFFTYTICTLISIFSGIGSFSSSFCSKTFVCRAFCVIILIISALMNIYNIDTAFSEDGKNISSKNIHIYDGDINTRINEAIDMLYTRSLYLKSTSIIILVIIIAIILFLYLIKKNEDNNQIQNAFIQDINYMQNDYIYNNHYNYNNQYNNSLNNLANNPVNNPVNNPLYNSLNNSSNNNQINLQN